MIELSKLALTGIIAGSFIIGGSLGLVITSCIVAGDHRDDEYNDDFEDENE